MKTSDIEKIVYFQDYVVTDPGKTPLKKKQLLTEDEYRAAYEKYSSEFEAEMGAEDDQEAPGHDRSSQQKPPRSAPTSKRPTANRRSRT